MNRILLTISVVFIFLTPYAQPNNYWQQKVNYKISASLDDSAHSIIGFLSIEYFNQSPDTLSKLLFHLWPNAYSNDRTAFSEQLIENGNTDFYFSNEISKGYINALDFKVDQHKVSYFINGNNPDIIEIVLPEKLLPGNKISLTTPFYTKLPDVFSRSGHIDQTYQIAQWYPKPAVYDKNGWHAIPYLDQGEFYSEFGEFDVTITLPSKYKLASTGECISLTTANDTSVYRFVQNNVHDFAWFADKDFEVEKDTLMLPSGKIIETQLFHYSNKSGIWKVGMSCLKNAILTKCKWIGEYPYSKVSVVESKLPNWGGMEYPMVTLIEKASTIKELDNLIHHEVGHNWFYGILGSNEREFPWMDEGMNTYYDKRYQQQKYTNSSLNDLPSFLKKRIPEDFEALMLKTVCLSKTDQPISTSAEKFSAINYGLIAYQKTASWMQQIAEELGKPAFDNMMRQYFETWKFKHPYPEDFKLILEKNLPGRSDYYFKQLDIKGLEKIKKKKTFKPMTFFSLKDAEKYNHLFIMPIVGFNNYDGLMGGLLLHNYTLPLSRFNYFAIPLFGNTSKKLGGMGRVSFTSYPDKKIKKIESSISFSHFTNGTFTDSSNDKRNLFFSKISPEVKLVFNPNNERSTINRYLLFKSYFISESNLSFSRDTINNKDVIAFPVRNNNFHLIRYGIENNRKLYPYQALFNVEKGKDFARISLTANSFFNYEKKGGFWLRFFAGKFQYLKSDVSRLQFTTDRYHLNMTGANGYEDYTYNNWFLGRNEFEGLGSQQIMMKDGGFKIRTDLLSNKIGRTDNWLVAMNCSSTVPDQFNPLSVLPFKLPLRLFADLGTNDLCWRENAETEKLLYDAGIEFAFLNDCVHIYFPLLYSKSFRNYVNSVYADRKVLRTMSFSINLQSISLKRIFPQSPL